MDFKISKSTIDKALNNVSSSTSNNLMMQILSSVKFSINNNKVNLTTTNLETETTDFFECDTNNNIEFAVPLKTVHSIIKSCKAEEIEFLVDKNGEENVSYLHIKFGKSKFKVKTISVEDFPERLNKEVSGKVTIDSSDLSNLISVTDFSISQNTDRYNLTGLFIQTKLEENGDPYLYSVSTDGHRLSIGKKKLEEYIDINGCLVPKKSVTDLKKLLKSDKKCSIGFDEKISKISFKIGSICFTTKLLDADFPNYEKVIPSKNDKILELEKGDLANALVRLKIINDLKGKGIQIKLYNNKMILVAKSDSGDVGEDEIECSFIGNDSEEPFVTTYNPIFIEEPLKYITESKIRISFSEAQSPALLQTIENTDIQYVIMPMRNAS